MAAPRRVRPLVVPAARMAAATRLASPAAAGCSSSPSISAQPDTTIGGLALGVELRPARSATGGRWEHARHAVAPERGRDAAAGRDASARRRPMASQACSEAQFGLSNASEPTCPNASKIGTAEIVSPLTADPLQGVDLSGPAEQQPVRLPAGDLRRDRGRQRDDQAGRPRRSRSGHRPAADDLHEQSAAPVQRLQAELLRRSARCAGDAERCGTFTTTSSIDALERRSAGDADGLVHDQLRLRQRLRPDAHRRRTQSTEAGASSPFVLSIARSDTDQEMSGLNVSLPGRPAGQDRRCDAVHATPRRARARARRDSQVGTALTGAGPGTEPVLPSGQGLSDWSLQGRARTDWSRSSRRSPGPLNLGTVIVRQSLNIDKTDAHVTVVSDPLPTILDGIPLRLRRIDVNLNRPGSCNPTNCTLEDDQRDADLDQGPVGDAQRPASRSVAAVTWRSRRSSSSRRAAPRRPASTPS